MNEKQRDLTKRNIKNTRPPRRRRRSAPLLYFAVIALLFLLMVVLFQIAGCFRQKSPEEDSTQAAASDSADTEVITETETTVPVSTEPLVEPYDYSLPVPTGDPVDDTYFDDAVFIGNSRTQGFMMYSGLSNATYYAAQGLMISNVSTDRLINQNGEKVTVTDALRNSPSFGKVYLMFGINELGWSNTDSFAQKYGELVDIIRGINPDAVIYVQSIYPVSKAKSDSDQIYNMTRINTFNGLIRKMAEDKKVYYVNIAEALSDENGYLPADAALDGVHLKKSYCELWLTYLKNHTVSE